MRKMMRASLRMGEVSLMKKEDDIRKLGRHWYDQTVMTRANLVDTV